MARKKYSRADEENDLSYSEEMAKGTEQTTEASENAQPVSGEEITFKKRYADLRRHSQQLLSQKDKQIADTRRQLEVASKAQIKYPKTDEEIKQWEKKYPDVAQVIDTIARKRSAEALEEGEKRLAGLRDLETKLTRKEAEQELMKAHPDFSEIRQDPVFHEWVAEQPSYIADALYKNNTDARAASRAIDLYKADQGTVKKSPKSAAASVGRTSSSAPTTKTKAAFSESQINNMSDKEFAENDKAIRKSIDDGTFNYDITGSAR